MLRPLTRKERQSHASLAQGPRLPSDGNTGYSAGDLAAQRTREVAQASSPAAGVKAEGRQRGHSILPELAFPGVWGCQLAGATCHRARGSLWIPCAWTYGGR